MTAEVSPERVDKIIDQLAKYVVDRDMETQAILTIEMHKPASFFLGQMGMLYFSPIFGMLPPELAQTGNAMFSVLQSKKNLEKLLVKIETLSEEKKQRRQQRKKAQGDTGFLTKLKRLLYGKT